MVLIAPTDTGMWHMQGCDPQDNDTRLEFPGPPGPGHKGLVNCSAWNPQIVGTLDHHDHLILAGWTTRGNKSNPRQSLVNNARLFFERSPFAGEYDKLPNVTTQHYWEANIIANPRLPAGVKFIVAHFPVLFGTSAGRKLQELAEHYSWPLMWALGNANMTTAHHGPPGPGPHPRPPLPHNGSWPNGSWPHPPHSPFDPVPGNERFLDPALGLRFTNGTVSDEMTRQFEDTWAVAEDARRGNVSQVMVQTWWDQLKKKQTRMAPLTAGSCSDSACFGIAIPSKDCVCPSSLVFVA